MKKKKEKMEYYSLDRIKSYDAQYNIIFSGRSNGKTYSVLKEIVEIFWNTGGIKQGAYVRRWRDDFTGKRGQEVFSNLVSNGEIKRITGGEWTDVYYWRQAWYLARRNDSDEMEHDDRPFCYGFAISTQEHDKSSAYPDIWTILFDEIITRSSYLPDEFILFCNLLSTIIRTRTGVKIYMCGNTINKYNPYFGEMGLTHAKNMTAGTIDIYTYGENGKLRVAVEYAENRVGKKAMEYFAFDNPKLQMITGQEWEIDIYPHCPYKYKPKDIVCTYFIKFNNELLQCEIVCMDNRAFTFIHRKTTPIQDENKDMIYQTDYDARMNYARKINKPANKMQKRIAQMFMHEKVFYQDNEVGEIVRNYLQWCGK